MPAPKPSPVARGEAVTLAKLDELAAFANEKVEASVSPTSAAYDDPPFAFSAFSSDVEPPSGVAAEIVAGTGYEYARRVLVHVYAYKDVDGRRTYSAKFATGWIKLQANDVPCNLDWSWTASPSAPDGYIVDYRDGGIYTTGIGKWVDVAGTSFTDDWVSLNDPFLNSSGDLWGGVTSGWMAARNPVDYADYAPGSPEPFYWSRQNGPWLRELNMLRNWIFNPANYTPDETWRVSGPWCVSVGPVLRFGDVVIEGQGLANNGYWSPDNLGATVLVSGVGTKGDFYTATAPTGPNATVDGYSDWVAGDVVWFNGTKWEVKRPSEFYGDIEFWYAQDDDNRSGDIDIYEVKEDLLEFVTGGYYDTVTVAGGYAGKTFDAYGKMVFKYTGDSTGYYADFAFTSGLGTVVSQNWTDDGTYLTLDYRVTFTGEAVFTASLSVGSTQVWGWFHGYLRTVLYQYAVWTTFDMAGLHPTSSVGMALIDDLSTPRANCITVAPQWVDNAMTELQGVWVAKTHPVFGEHSMVQNDLSKYAWNGANYLNQLYPDTTMIEGASSQATVFVGKPSGNRVSPSGFFLQFESDPPMYPPHGNGLEDAPFPLTDYYPNNVLFGNWQGTEFTRPYGDPHPDNWWGVATAAGGWSNEVGFDGTWNAATNTPPLANTVTVEGHYYTVSVSGSTSLGGESSWEAGVDAAQFWKGGWVKRKMANKSLDFTDHHGSIIVSGVPEDALASTDRMWVTVGVQDLVYQDKGFSHLFPSDLIMVLEAPDGSKTVLMGYNGGSVPVTNAELTFGEVSSLDGAMRAKSLPTAPDDGITSALYIPSLNDHFFDSYPDPAAELASDLARLDDPLQYAEYRIGPVRAGVEYNHSPPFGNFTGINPNGRWKLYIFDRTLLDGVLVNAWRLTFAWGSGLAPAVPNRPALWPVFRSTDFWGWDAGTGQTGRYPVPYYPANESDLLISQLEFSDVADGELTGEGRCSSPAGSSTVLRASDPDMTIYWNTTGDLIEADGTGSEGSGVGAVSLGASATGGYTFKGKNGSGAALASGNVAAIVKRSTYTAGQAPKFFKDGYENYSFVVPKSGLPDPVFSPDGGYCEVPQRGYCVTRLVVTRRASGSGIAVIPGGAEGFYDGEWDADANSPALASSVGSERHYRRVATAGATSLNGAGPWSVGDVAFFEGGVWTKKLAADNLSVEVGVMRGSDFDTAGTLAVFETAYLPANVGRVALDVFWPVVGGCPLAYEAADPVDIQAFCNFQPLVCSQFWPPDPEADETDVRIKYKGQWAGPWRRTLGGETGGPEQVSGSFSNYQPTSGTHCVPVTFPVAPCLYNDAVEALDLL